MKKLTYIFLVLFCCSSAMFAQSELDALRFSKNELNGTARAMGMGGAFGALGGDQSGVSVNPAGIGIYRSSEVVATMNANRETSEIEGKKEVQNQFSFDNLGFVGVFPLNNYVMPSINVGFSFNRAKSFNRTFSGEYTTNGSLMDYMAFRAGDTPEANLQMGENLPDPFFSQDWLATLGYNSYLINPHEDAQGIFYSPTIPTEKPLTSIWARQHGYIDNYDFTLGGTINDVLSWGAALSISEVYYATETTYGETFAKGYFDLNNWNATKGAGVGGSLGLIYRPVNELRLGLAYHTPTYFTLQEEYSASLKEDVGAYVSDENYEPGTTETASFWNNYSLVSPGKLVLSAAGVLSNRFIASVDYELKNYKNMQLRRPSNELDASTFYQYDNEYIKQDFKMTSTIRAGVEFRATPQFSLRAGYACYFSPYETEFKEKANPAVAGSNSIFLIEGDSQYYTAGLGYRFSPNFYMDMAVVFRNQVDRIAGFPNVYDDNGNISIDASPVGIVNNNLRGLLTLGYRF